MGFIKNIVFLIENLDLLMEILFFEKIAETTMGFIKNLVFFIENLDLLMEILLC